MTPSAPVVPGAVFGKLTVDHLDHSSHLGRHWFCRCDCGGAAIRTSADLNLSREKKFGCMCRACWVAMRANRRERRSTFQKRCLMGWWRRYGSLFTPAQEREIEQSVRDEVGEACGGWRPWLESVPDVAEPEEAEEAREVSGANDDYAMSHAEIGAVLGCGRTRVWQIEQKALQKMRDEFVRLGIMTRAEARR